MLASLAARCLLIVCVPGLTANAVAGDEVDARYWVALSAGTDSNINSAPELTSVRIPVLGNRVMPLKSPLLTAMPSSFAGVRAGFDAIRPLSPDTRLWVEGEAALRLHPAEAVYAPHRYGFAAGLHHRGEMGDGEVSAFWRSQWVARFEMENIRGLATAFRVPVADRLAVMLGGDLHENHYPYFLGIRTQGHRLAFGLESRGDADAPSLSLTFRHGPDRSKGAIRDMDRTVEEATLAGIWPLSSGHRVSFRLWQHRHRYDETSPLFLVRRDDRNTGASIGYDIDLAPAWRLTLAASAELNASNLPLTTFTRNQLGVELRWTWGGTRQEATRPADVSDMLPRQNFQFADYVMVRQQETLNSLGISVAPINQAIFGFLGGLVGRGH